MGLRWWSKGEKNSSVTLLITPCLGAYSLCPCFHVARPSYLFPAPLRQGNGASQPTDVHKNPSKSQPHQPHASDTLSLFIHALEYDWNPKCIYNIIPSFASQGTASKASSNQGDHIQRSLPFLLHEKLYQTNSFVRIQNLTHLVYLIHLPHTVVTVFKK